MRLEPACSSCMVRMASNTTAQVSRDRAVQQRVLRRVMRLLAEVDWEQPPPHVGGMLERLVREETGSADPYALDKERVNAELLELLPSLRARLADHPDPLDAAVRLAIAGNIIDFGVGLQPHEVDVQQIVDAALSLPLVIDAVDELRAAMEGARRVLYFLDNAGEIVLDRLLIEILGPARVTAVVRGGPALNDVLRADAEQVELPCEVIDNGRDLPGTDLNAATLRQRWADADVVISKGQGNFETLHAEAHPAVFFLFRAKCGPVSRMVGVPEGSALMLRGPVG